MNSREIPPVEPIEEAPVPEKESNKEQGKERYFIRRDKGKYEEVNKGQYAMEANSAGFRSDLFSPPVASFSSFDSHDPDFGEISTEGRIVHSDKEVEELLKEEENERRKIKGRK